MIGQISSTQPFASEPERTRSNKTVSNLAKTAGTVQADSEELSAEEKLLVQQLKKKDREVRAHEQAHVNVGRDLIQSGPHYEYTQGPDGKTYAIGGEVSIDTSAVQNDAEATFYKAQHIRRTALAPAKPSTTDFQVANKATVMSAQARQEMARLRYEEIQVRMQDLSNGPGELYEVSEVGGEVDFTA